MSRFDAVRDGVSLQRVLVSLGIHADSSRVCRLAVRTVAVRSPAGALIFHKRAGQHFVEPSETPDELTAQPAQPQTRATADHHHPLIMPTKTSILSRPLEGARIWETGAASI